MQLIFSYLLIVAQAFGLTGETAQGSVSALRNACGCIVRMVEEHMNALDLEAIRRAVARGPGAGVRDDL